MNRKDVIENLKNRLNDLHNGYQTYLEHGGKQDIETESDIEALNMAIEALQEPERKKGQWEDFDYDNSYLCTSCGEIWTLNDGTPEENNMNYCPNCGADMRKNEEELKQALAKELGCDPDEIARIIA